MRTLILMATFMAVIGLAFWAYQENYKTQQAMGHVEKLQGDIGKAQARLNTLKAEWAYLNRPNRLRELAEINFEKLQLLPFSPDQFGRIDQVAFPTEAAHQAPLKITNSVDVSNLEAKP